MAPPRVLFVDAAGLTACVGRRRTVTIDAAFAPDATGRQAFAAYLAAHADSRFYVLAELAEEGFQADVVPYLSGRDRAAVVARKLGQAFYGTPFTVAWSQGRLGDGRRDERLLCAALLRPQLLEPWLDALQRADAALAGVFSLPQAVAMLAAEPARSHQHLLLTTLTRGGLRQTYFAAGRLRFSRLTAVPADTAEAAATACAAATAQIHQYLAGQRLLDHNTPLAVLVLAHPAHAEPFRRHCRDSDALRFELLDLLAAARRHGLATDLPDSHSELLCTHLLLRQTPRTQFAPAAALRSFRLHRVRRLLHGAGLTALAGCLLLAGKQSIDARALAANTALIRLENERTRSACAAARQALPQTSVPLDQLRLRIDRYEALLKAAPGPAALYGRLSRAIADFPQIEFDRLDWRLADRGEWDAEAGAGPFASVDVYATLAATDDRHRQIDIIDRFVARLRSDPAVRVRTLSLPFDTAAGTILSSGDGAAAAAAPKFALRVAEPLRP